MHCDHVTCITTNLTHNGRYWANFIVCGADYECVSRYYVIIATYNNCRSCSCCSGCFSTVVDPNSATKIDVAVQAASPLSLIPLLLPMLLLLRRPLQHWSWSHFCYQCCCSSYAANSDWYSSVLSLLRWLKVVLLPPLQLLMLLPPLIRLPQQLLLLAIVRCCSVRNKSGHDGLYTNLFVVFVSMSFNCDRT